MKIFQKLKSRQADMSTLSTVMESSLRKASEAGEPIAGAHHLALAVFEMPDGVAEAIMNDLGSSGSAFSEALASLDADVLANLGIEIDSVDVESGPIPPQRLGKTDATYEAAIKAAHDVHNAGHDYRPLTGAHLLAGVASVNVGVAARVFAALGIERDSVLEAARD